MLLLSAVWCAALQAQPPRPRSFPAPAPPSEPASIARAPLALFPTRTLWRLGLDAALTAEPGFSGDRAYFAIEGDRLAAYDLEAGALLWLVSTRTAAEPIAGGGLLFIVEPDALTALHKADGSVAWRLPFAEASGTRLVWDHGWLIAADAAGAIHAYRAADGELIWRREVGARVNARPTLAHDRLYVPLTDGRLLALRVETGAPVWERRLGGAPHEVLALDDRLYVGSVDNYLYCLTAEDGGTDWRWRTGGDVIGLPVADEKRVYFVSLDNVLRGLDRNNGAQRWKRALPLRPSGGPIIVGRALLVSGLAPDVRAYLMTDGTETGNVAPGGELAAPPHVVHGDTIPTLVIVTRDIAKGAIVTAITRSIEPAIVPLGPLPNPTPIPPVAFP